MPEGGGRYFHEQIMKLNADIELEITKKELGEGDCLKEKVEALREVERKRDEFMAELLIRLDV